MLHASHVEWRLTKSCMLEGGVLVSGNRFRVRASLARLRQAPKSKTSRAKKPTSHAKLGDLPRSTIQPISYPQCRVYSFWHGDPFPGSNQELPVTNHISHGVHSVCSATRKVNESPRKR